MQMMTREHRREYKSRNLQVRELEKNKEEMDCRQWRRYENNGNKTVEKEKWRNSRMEV